MAKKEIVAEAEVKAPVGKEKARREAIVEAYKIKNPVKFEQKKAALEKWVKEA